VLKNTGLRRISADFPLREFRSRHSAATEAVGYGKTLMGFTCCAASSATRHSASRSAAFYKEYRGQRAGFTDVPDRVRAHHRAGTSTASFDEWVNRAGAADLVVGSVKTPARTGRYTR